MTDEIPDAHPRSESLRYRHKIIEGMHDQIVAEAGLIAHGRGEAYDYLLGEKTHDFAEDAIKAAVASLYLAEHPVLSINGNVTVLCPEELIEFSKLYDIPMEVNLFYRRPERLEAIERYFAKLGFTELLGLNEEFSTEINEISSKRRIVDTRGIGKADVVFVPLEDGDRTEGLVNNQKHVITVDLNPLSRTSQKAHITIVDNIIRVLPLMIKYYSEMTTERATNILDQYDNDEIISRSLETMSGFWKERLKG